MTLPGGFYSLYYIGGTLAFAVADWVLAAPIRAAFLGRPQQRILYYVVLVALGLLCRAKPRWAPVVGIGESAVNLLLVLLSILLPVFTLVDQVEAGGPIGLPFTTWTFVNVLITGSVLIYSFNRSQRALLNRSRDS